MPDAAPLDHPAVKALLDLTPTMPQEMVAAAGILRGEFGFRTADLPQSQTLLCVGRCRDDDGEQITVVTRSACGDLVVHTCFDDPEQPLYGYNTYQNPASMVRKMDDSMEDGQTWCGAYERELFGRLAADCALP